MEANQQTSTPVNQKQENTQNNKKEEKPLCPSLRLKNYLYYFIHSKINVQTFNLIFPFNKHIKNNHMR
jgi:hypothetical protein